MNISNNWFAFALLITAFGVGYALGHYNTDEIIVLGYDESASKYAIIRKTNGNVYTCYGDNCRKLKLYDDVADIPGTPENMRIENILQRIGNAQNEGDNP